VDNVATILSLHARVSAAGFGELLLPPAVPFVGPTGTIHVKPVLAERKSIETFLLRLVRDFRFQYQRDQLEVTYQDGLITLARVTFLAGAG
jgi:hypothetical protein